VSYLPETIYHFLHRTALNNSYDGTSKEILCEAWTNSATNQMIISMQHKTHTALQRVPEKNKWFMRDFRNTSTEGGSSLKPELHNLS
jgi:transcriptional regulator of met regulon